MRSHDDIGIVRRDDVGRGPDHIVQAAARIVKDHFDLAAEDAAAPIYFRDGEQRSVDAGRSPDPRRSRQRHEVYDSELFSIAALIEKFPAIGMHRRTWRS